MSSRSWLTALVFGALSAALSGGGVAKATIPPPEWTGKLACSLGEEPMVEGGKELLALPGGYWVRSLEEGTASDLATDELPEPTCPEDMVRVKGSYCTEVKQNCLEWLDDEHLPYARCAIYEDPVQCVGQRVPMSFCIDRFEYTRPGDDLPLNQQSFDLAGKLCQSLGKRICTESEWNFACEGETMLPYPYGLAREPKCNQDRDDLFQMIEVDGKRKQVLKDNRQASRSSSECVSPFGVYDMVGNLDEPVLREATRYSPPFRNSLKGGWWMAARNRCRPATTAHDDYYKDTQIGVRCCADLPDEGAPAG
ncbi:MAG: SUMF1/EgtB/PvdO family nonheme iron enzyme [Polyangiaceae bacterium]|nr:SUMF1/EgtB/PvdO family nonheme iron enzyme [Polyangiaceae bacterium]